MPPCRRHLFSTSLAAPAAHIPCHALVLQRLVSTFCSEPLGPEGAAQFAWSPQGDFLAAAGARVRIAARLLHPAQRVGGASCWPAKNWHIFRKPLLVLCWPIHLQKKKVVLFDQGGGVTASFTVPGGCGPRDGTIQAGAIRHICHMRLHVLPWRAAEGHLASHAADCVACRACRGDVLQKL